MLDPAKKDTFVSPRFDHPNLRSPVSPQATTFLEIKSSEQILVGESCSSMRIRSDGKRWTLNNIIQHQFTVLSSSHGWAAGRRWQCWSHQPRPSDRAQHWPTFLHNQQLKSCLNSPHTSSCGPLAHKHLYEDHGAAERARNVPRAKKVASSCEKGHQGHWQSDTRGICPVSSTSD